MKIELAWGSLESNHHGTNKKGTPWNNETIKGWLVKVVKLETIVRVGTSETWKVQAMVGRRLWIYAPSGACWNFDVYVTNTVSQ